MNSFRWLDERHAEILGVTIVDMSPTVPHGMNNMPMPTAFSVH